MDASDIIRMRNANTQFSYYTKNVLAKQKCYSDRNLDISGGCPLTFTSYAQKYLLKEGAKDLSGYIPPIVPLPTYNNKLGFYTLMRINGYNTYQYRFYDGWGPLIDSTINSSQYSIYDSYYGLGFQYAHFNDGEGNVRLQILDSTGKIINTIAYKSYDYGGYYNGERYGILCYQTPSETNTFVFIDPLHNTTKTFTTNRSFYGSAGVTGSAVSFVVYDGFYNYFYTWPANAEQPYVALTFQDFTFPYTPDDIDFVAFATDDGNGFNKVSTLLADGTFLTYTLNSGYYGINISYYGINNSRLYVIGYNNNNTFDLYLFKLNATDFINPKIITQITNENDHNVIAYVDLYKDKLTAQNNHFGIYIYNSVSASYAAPFYNATFIAVFENGTVNSNHYSASTSNTISEYVGINSNGFTLFAYNATSTDMYSYVIKPSGTLSNNLTRTVLDINSSDYFIRCENLNDYVYFDIYNPSSTTDTNHYGFVVHTTNNTTSKQFTYANRYKGDVTIVTSGNSLCCSLQYDTRLAYFNPSVSDLYGVVNVAFNGYAIYTSYPDLASGVIFSLNENGTFNILTSTSFTGNIAISDLNIINNEVYYNIFSDNVSLLAYVDNGDYYSLYLYNVDSNATIRRSNFIARDWGYINFENTPTTGMYSLYDQDEALTYISYDINTTQFNIYAESNYINNYVLRTNNYLTTNN